MSSVFLELGSILESRNTFNFRWLGFKEDPKKEYTTLPVDVLTV